jgi:hypothetical protein
MIHRAHLGPMIAGDDMLVRDGEGEEIAPHVPRGLMGVAGQFL